MATKEKTLGSGNVGALFKDDSKRRAIMDYIVKCKDLRQIVLSSITKNEFIAEITRRENEGTSQYKIEGCIHYIRFIIRTEGLYAIQINRLLADCRIALGIGPLEGDDDDEFDDGVVPHLRTG
ncbi:hypothetical protein SEMRO_139_G064970.1 [Seminavis robusta]|uniref:Uncharacterized protein n=1 Tax=Seminavis robusta TaxID=568900 RepID=A0A9N8DGV7_9STRA|nr:hypothetical protein SEMRO_139_G064970.1 [Seminavis robusta]|eukprot:Sro139_g064970.1 n/a (123) ;mRNA; f:13403-13771